MEKHRSTYPQLTQEAWDEMSFRLLQNNQKLSAIQIIAFLEGLEVRLAANSFQRTDTINNIRAGVLAEMSTLTWSGSERLELIGLATELAVKILGLGEQSQHIAKFLISPAAEGIPDFKLHSRAFLAAFNGAGEGNSYLTTCNGEGGTVLGYGVTFGNQPNLKGDFYSRNVTRARGFGGPIASTADFDGVASDPKPQQVGELGLFDAHFPVPNDRGWIHSFLPEVMASLLRTNSAENVSVSDEADLAKTVLKLSDRRYPQTATTLNFVQDFRRTFGDLTVNISEVNQLIAFLQEPTAQKPIVDTVFKEVAKYRKQRKGPLLSFLSAFWAGNSLDEICDRLVADQAPDQKTDIEPGSDD